MQPEILFYAVNSDDNFISSLHSMISHEIAFLGIGYKIVSPKEMMSMFHKINEIKEQYATQKTINNLNAEHKLLPLFACKNADNEVLLHLGLRTNEFTGYQLIGYFSIKRSDNFDKQLEYIKALIKSNLNSEIGKISLDK